MGTIISTGLDLAGISNNHTLTSVCQIVESEVRTLLRHRPKTGRQELPSHAAVIFEHLLSAIAVMNIEINNQDFGRQTSAVSQNQNWWFSIWSHTRAHTHTDD